MNYSCFNASTGLMIAALAEWKETVRFCEKKGCLRKGSLKTGFFNLINPPDGGQLIQSVQVNPSPILLNEKF